MNAETLRQEKAKIEEKIRELKAKMLRNLEKGKFLGLDRQVRRLQHTYQLLRRI